MALFQDNFNRADANLEAGAGWTQVDGTAGWGAVRSNALACMTADSSGAAYQCTDTGSLQHYVQGKLATVSSPSGPFLCCRLADRNNFVGVRYDSAAGRIELYRRNAGTLTSLAPVLITCVVGDVIKLQMDGANGWSIYKNGVLADSGSSSGIASLTSTRCGVVMRAQATNPWIDDFEASNWPLAGSGMDFPSSPTTGQIFAAPSGPTYVWNGTAWTGGQMAGPVTEQVFDMSGKTAQDITIPSWAKSCEIEGFGPGVVSPLIARYSLDGTTFLNGASDYTYWAPYHYTGSSLYQTQPAVNLSFMYINFGGDNAAVPHHFVANLTLTRPDTGKVLGVMQSMGQSVDTAAAALNRTSWISGYLGVAAAGSALRVAAIRVQLFSGAALPAGSWLRVKWSGDSAQVPVSNAIPEAPMDGQGYVRESGLWVPSGVRKISSGVLAVNAPSFDVALPAGYSFFELMIGNVTPTVTTSMVMYMSNDGTTFPAAATDIVTAYNIVSSTGVNTPTGGSNPYGLLSASIASNAGNRAFFKLAMPVTIAGTLQPVMFDAYYMAANYYRANGMIFHGQLGGPLKALRFAVGTGNFASGLTWQLNGWK